MQTKATTPATRLSSTSRNPKFENMPEHLTAHAIRRLRPCTYCKGLGDGSQMIRAEGDLRTHTHCFVLEHGYAATLKLSAEEMGKFRLCDLPASQMRKLHLARQKKSTGAKR
jgi:hypothetical protein